MQDLLRFNLAGRRVVDRVLDIARRQNRWQVQVGYAGMDLQEAAWISLSKSRQFVGDMVRKFLERPDLSPSLVKDRPKILTALGF